MEDNIFKTRQDETIFISSEGLQRLVKTYKKGDKGKNIFWTTDYNVELPIRIKKTGIASRKPVTLIEQFLRVIQQYPTRFALSQKIKGKWISITYKEYFQECVKFGKSLIKLGLHYNAINIIGFNAMEWNISFFGSLFAGCLPVGIYTTNLQASCIYIARHCQCKMVVSQNYQLAKKYFSLLKQKFISHIVIYKEQKINGDDFGGRIILWKDFLKIGQKVQDNQIYKRMKSTKPGNCCTLVYTSGTTGMPKGVMLSHDNYTWVTKSSMSRRDNSKQSLKTVSYLPLSHVAAQLQDITGAMQETAHIFFADPNALQGTLIQTLLEVRPTAFFSVPRVWQKIEQKMKAIASQNGWLKSKIANWAKSIGPEGTLLEINQKQTSLQFKIAKILVYNNVKKALGLDQCKYLFYGAAPLAPEIRNYFLSLNFFLINGYGMSECSGPQTLSERKLMKKDLQFMREAGTQIPGTQMKIHKTKFQDQEGQICYRGRNVFMGYYKNQEQTIKTIDQDGYLHSGDMGKFDKNGVLFITGRLKQLLITAAGQNIPPVLIQNQLKQKVPIISNAILIGDGKKFLTVLITLKTQQNRKLWNLQFYKNLGSNSTTPQQAKTDAKVIKVIKDAIQKTNEKAISRAQKIQNFEILPQDFTVQNGLLTPTLKLKRKQVVKRYSDIIENFYREAKL